MAWNDAGLYTQGARPLPTPSSPWEYGDQVSVCSVWEGSANMGATPMEVECLVDRGSGREPEGGMVHLVNSSEGLSVEGVAPNLVAALIDLGPEEGRRCLSLVTGRAVDAAWCLLRSKG